MELIEQLSEEMSDLTNELENATGGKVHVYDTVYQGARIIIASDIFKVNDDIKYATFKFKEGQVTYVPCEIRKG